MPEFHDDWIDRLKADVRALSADLDASIAREAATRQASLHAGDLYEQMRARAEAAELQAGELRKALGQARGTLRDFTENWDCDEDAHRYRTPCRCCLAEKASNEADAALAAPAPTLHAELEAGRRDTARLDKVEAMVKAHGMGWFHLQSDGGIATFPIDYGQFGLPCAQSARDAIDATPTGVK